MVKNWRNSNLQMEYFMPTLDSATISSTLEKHVSRRNIPRWTIHVEAVIACSSTSMLDVGFAK